MSSLSFNLGDSTSQPLQAGLPDKKTIVLGHLASSKALVDVRPASRLEIRPRPEMISTGISELDALTGGLPRGCLSEICGAGSSGKTSVLLATLAAATRRDESCVLIDASDSFDPESGATAGVNFGKLLWVRCGTSSAIGRQSSAKKSSIVGHWPLTPGFIADDCFANDQRRTTNEVISDDFYAHDSQRMMHDGFTKTRNEHRLAQVLKTTDLVLQSGGFGLVVLDLAGIPEKFVRRIPLASWFRFQRAVEHTKTALLVVSEFPCAQTCASVVLKLSSQHSACSIQLLVSPHTFSPAFFEGWEHSSGPNHTQLLEKMKIEAELARTRLERKPMQSVRVNFATRAVRAG